jgi:hypothetical protein
MRSGMSMVTGVGQRTSGWLALLWFVGIFLAPTPAAANSYHAFLCRVPYGPHAGRAAPAAGVTYATFEGPYLYAGDTCAEGGAMYAAMDGGDTHPYGASALDTFVAPAGLTISGFTLWRYEADGPSQPYGSPASNLLYAPGPPSVQGLCTDGCSRGTQADPLASSNTVSSPPLTGVTQIQWSAACGGGPGGTCPASGSGTFSSQYDVYAADVDLVDDTPPSVSSVGGPLVAGGTLTGAQAVSFDASDGQSGVYGGSLIVDGHAEVARILDTNGGACQSLNVTSDGQRSFEYAQPCKPSLSASLALNTSQLAAGAHSLELIVEDAAGNQTVAYNGTISVGGSSQAPIVIGPGSPLALRGPTNGTNASDQAKLTARWESTAKATRTSHYGQADRVTGRLTTTAGQPISDAMLDVAMTRADQGARTAPLASVRTGPTGEWTLTLPKSSCSSVLRLAYRSHVNDTVSVAASNLTLRVHAGIALRIAPRVTSVGRKIVFTGLLHGAPIPAGGKQLVLEASSGGEWVQFDTVTTNTKGGYRATYRFKFPGPVTYRFRVYVPQEADFPFLEGTSNVVGVYER